MKEDFPLQLRGIVKDARGITCLQTLDSEKAVIQTRKREIIIAKGAPKSEINVRVALSRDCLFKIIDGKLRIAKIGDLKIVLHRPIEGVIKTLTIRRTASDEWFACFSCECIPEPLPANVEVVGIDVGLTSFATLSNGEKIDNPRFFKKDEYNINHARRNLNKTTKGTPEYMKRKHVAVLVHKRIANRRKDFAHQLSRKLVNRFGIICIEDINITPMLHNRFIKKSISDAAWMQFLDYISYKAEWAGRKIVSVNPSYTSQTCSSCGFKQKLTLSVREFRCPCCNIIIDRDINAALNILALGLQCIGNQSVETTSLLVE